MKYRVRMSGMAYMRGTVEVDADSEEKAREKALEEAREADFELDVIIYDHVSTEDVSCKDEEDE